MTEVCLKQFINSKIFTSKVMDNLASLTDKNFQFEKLSDGSFIVNLLVSKEENIQDKLLMLGSDVELMYPEYSPCEQTLIFKITIAVDYFLIYC